MSDWVCHDCGTINHDMLDGTPMSLKHEELYEKEVKRRQKIELDGGRTDMYCNHCRAQRK